jgi:hypothetical protein
VTIASEREKIEDKVKNDRDMLRDRDTGYRRGSEKTT